MPPALLFEQSRLARDRVLVDREQIYQSLPHRHEFALLDGILYLNAERGEAAGFSDVTESAFWVRGHIPGRPIMPGVMIIEVAAQLASFATARLFTERHSFFGLGGVDKVKFRDTVTPGSRLLVLSKVLETRSRKLVWACQGLVGDRLVFEGEITGMPV